MTAFTLDLSSIVTLTDEQFFQLCQLHRDYRFERTATGELIVMTPAGGETGNRNADLIFQLKNWNRQQKTGLVFDSSTGFKLPNGADRAPDASWVARRRWDELTPEQRQKFPPLCPDFVVELCSPSDVLKTVQAKMREYLENGAQLGWLLDPETERVEIYRPERAVEVLRSPATLSGEQVLPGFVLDVAAVMHPDS
jgi:Uma2 family endonuclease